MAVMLIATAAFSVSAAEAARRYDPATLQPTSERVIFIKDAPKGEKLTGDGSGFDANNPYIPVEHEKFDPSADAPMNHLQTAFYQATEILGDDGGTIVICGPVHLGANESHGSGATTKDVFTYNWGVKKVIKFTSVYNGVDYRETAGAKITLETPAELGILGSSIWDDITIEVDGTDRAMSFASCPTLIGPGFKTYPSDEAYSEVAANHLSLSGGHRYAKGTDQIPTLTVQAGTYNKIVGGLWGVLTDREMENATSYVTLEGTTKVLGAISGTVGKNSLYSGHVNITINAGTYMCDIYGCANTGFVNDDATVDIVINGGDFKDAWSICGYAPGVKNNVPASSLLDLSGYTGDKTALAQAFAVSADFTTVKLPENVTEAELIDLVAKETEPEATTPAETEPAPSETVKQTEKADKVTEKAEPVESVPSNNIQNGTQNDGQSSDSLMTVLIIVIIVAVVVIGGLGAAIIVILLKKKK